MNVPPYYYYVLINSCLTFVAVFFSIVLGLVMKLELDLRTDAAIASHITKNKSFIEVSEGFSKSMVYLLLQVVNIVFWSNYFLLAYAGRLYSTLGGLTPIFGMGVYLSLTLLVYREYRVITEKLLYGSNRDSK